MKNVEYKMNELTKKSSKFNYFTEKEAKWSKHEIFLQATLGLQTCKTKKDVIEILEDIWNIAHSEGVLFVYNQERPKIFFQKK